MKGALVFLAVFAIVLVLTLGNTSIPPGKALYDALLPGTEAASGFLVGGAVDAISLIIGVFNGVIYGFIAWLILTVVNSMFSKKNKQNVQQTVNVYTGDKKPETSAT